MLTDRLIKDIYEQNRTIVVYGMSTDPEKPAHMVPKFLMSKGFDIVPINPREDSIIDRKCYPGLRDVEENIGILNVFRPSDQALNVVQEAITRKQDRGDINVIWLQEGIENENARRLAEQAGILFIQDMCIKKEFMRIFNETENT